MWEQSHPSTVQAKAKTARFFSFATTGFQEYLKVEQEAQLCGTSSQCDGPPAVSGAVSLWPTHLLTVYSPAVHHPHFTGHFLRQQLCGVHRWIVVLAVVSVA